MHGRSLWIALAFAASLTACRSELLSTSTDGGSVGIRDGMQPQDLGLAGFCDDVKSARIEVNGRLAETPFVRARQQFLDCCEAASFEVTSMQIPGEAVPVVLSWRRFVGVGGWPITIDLAQPPEGFEVMMTSGCRLDDPSCTPNDTWTTGLTGTLTIAVLPDAGEFLMSVCAAAQEPSEMPHKVLHSVRLWAPNEPTTSS